MHWNHRIVREKDGDGYVLTFAEVYYDESGKPTGYGIPFVSGNDMGEMRQLVNRLGDAINQPVLNEEDFQQEHVPDSDEDIFEADPNSGWLPGDECPLCGKAETCKECK